MSGDTLGDCPLCGHQEASYDEWEFVRYVDDRVRVWRCRTCHRLVTSDLSGKVERFWLVRRPGAQPGEYQRKAALEALIGDLVEVHEDAGGTRLRLVYADGHEVTVAGRAYAEAQYVVVTPTHPDSIKKGT